LKQGRRTVKAKFKRMLSIFGRIPRNISKVRYLGLPVENERLARAEYYAGKTVMESLPPIVTFGLTTYCSNVTPCVICDRNVRPKEWNAEVNEKDIAAAKPLLQTAQYVLLHTGGEPMFSRYFDEVVRIIEPPTRISMATNGMLLTKKRANLMLERDVMGRIVISLDAATPGTYRIMRPSSDFDTVISNLTYYINRASSLNRKEASVSLCMTICNENLMDVPKLVELAGKLGIGYLNFNHLNEGLDFTLKLSDGRMWNYIEQQEFKDAVLHDEIIFETYKQAKSKGIQLLFVGKPFIGSDADKYDKKIVDEICGIVAFQENKEDVWSSPKHRLINPDVLPCFKPWHEVNIMPGGVVRICCFHDTSKPGVQIGNIFESDFMAIWNSETMVEERKQFLAHGFSQRCRASAPCLHRQRQ